MVFEIEIEDLERGVQWRDIKRRITDPGTKEDFDERHFVISLLLLSDIQPWGYSTARRDITRRDKATRNFKFRAELKE
jgi:hypothetical protein